MFLIQLELGVALTKQVLDELGENFEKATKGFIDFLLLNEKGFPFIVLEAKSEDKNPLVGKEQARKYAKSQNCRFVILSNPPLRANPSSWDSGIEAVADCQRLSQSTF